MTAPTLDRPGKELPKVWRDIATGLLAHEGWGYDRRSKHPQVVSPSGGRCSLPTTVTDGSAGHRASYLTALRRIGAPLDRDGNVIPPERPKTVSTPVFSDDMGNSLVADRSSVQPISTLGAWWHPDPKAEPEPADAPAPAVERPEPSPAFLALLERSTVGPTVVPRFKRSVPVHPEPTRQAAPQGEVYSLAQARTLLRQGYHVNKVVQKTGWDSSWFADMVDHTGYLALG